MLNFFQTPKMVSLVHGWDGGLQEGKMRISNIAIIATMAVIAMTAQAFAGAAPVSVPEPASMALLAIGVGGVIVAKLRRRK